MTQDNPIALVCDSTADIPESLLDPYQISVVPNILMVDGKSYVDGRDITREEFYQRLPGWRELPTTGTASAGEYEQLYEKLLSNGAQKIISIHAASNLSGIFNAAQVAANAFDNRVTVFDSQQLSLGTGFQVLAAAEAIKRSEPIESVIEIINDVRRRARVFAMLDTLEYVRRSGRVSWARARIGNFLNLKPFVEVQAGKVLSMGEARTRQRGIKRLKEFLLKLGPLDRLAILHSNAEADARQFMEDLDQFDHLAIPVVNITTIIGVHVGPQGLGFAAVVS